MLIINIMAVKINNLKEYKMNINFLANIILKGKIEVLTGLHIGGSKEKLEIGGVDSPVIRDPFTNYPFIPGSSLKGKLRMVLEFALDKVDASGDPHKSKNADDEICLIFGNFDKEAKVPSGPSRLVIRDAFPDESTISMWEKLDSELLYTEFKPENSINRLTAEANPRFLERIVKGSRFNIEMVYSIYDFDGDKGKRDLENFNHIVKGFKLLEHSGLGGNVSRGYGQIRFFLANPIVVKKDDYEKNSESFKNANSKLKDAELKSLADFNLPISL